MTWLLAWRNLARDRARFVVTLVGLAFSVVLMAVQWGLLTGCAETAAGLIDHAGADIWIASRGTSNVDQAVPMPARWRYRVLSVPGVIAVDKLIVRFTQWRRPDGRSEIVEIVGFDLDSGIGGPWKVVKGSIADLRRPRAVIIDRIYAAKLGVSALGQEVEIDNERARVVGFTQGIRAFSQSPYVFTSYANALRYGNLDQDRTNYLLVRTKPGVNKATISRRLQQSLPMLDVYTAQQFSRMTVRYWLLTTGAGLALVVGAALGMVVGVIIVSQTLYAATVERLPEYATLRAIGASDRYLNSVVLKQALISGIAGYGFGMAPAAGIAASLADSSVSLQLTGLLAAEVGVVTLLICAAGSLVAIRKIKSIEPTSVFR